MTPRNQNALRSGPDRQGGVVLLIALIVLIAMSLIGISMIRQGSSAQLIVGNLAFKEGTNAAADFGVEFARDQLRRNDFSVGYIANGLSVTFNPFQIPGNGWATATVPDELSQLGIGVEYVIHRLCATTGSVNTVCTPPPAGSAPGTQATCVENQCIVARETSSKEGTSYGNNPTPELFPYYRITVRVTGPRNVTSYVQALMY